MLDERLRNDREIESMDLGASGSASLGMHDTWKYEGAMFARRLYLVLLHVVGTSQ